MRKEVIFLLSLVLISSVLALTGCTDTNEIDSEDIPCRGVTVPINCAGNVSVISLNNTERYNVTTSLLGANQYNFTINFTDGSYQLTDCSNNTATIIIGDFPRDDLWKTAIMLGFIGIAFVLIILAKFSFDPKRWIMKTAFYICGSLMILISVQAGLILSKISGIDTMMVTALTIIITTVSIFFLYILIHYTKGLLQALRNKKKTQI